MRFRHSFNRAEAWPSLRLGPPQSTCTRTKIKWAYLYTSFSKQSTPVCLRHGILGGIFGRVLFNSLDLLSQKDYFKAMWTMLDSHGNPTFPTLGNTSCFMQQVSLQIYIFESTPDFANVFTCAQRWTFSTDRTKKYGETSPLAGRQDQPEGAGHQGGGRPEQHQHQFRRAAAVARVYGARSHDAH